MFLSCACGDAAHTTQKLMTIQSHVMQGADVRTPARFALATIAIAAAFGQKIVFADENRLNPTVVTASRSETKLDQTLADVRIITQEQLEQLPPGRSLAEALQRFAGAQLTSNGGRGNSQDITLRGSKQIILMIDGVRYGSATLGSLSLESLSTDNIERIEVIQGSASALYGSNAIGGVIQIFTKNGKNAKAEFIPEASATLGYSGFKSSTLGFIGNKNNWNYSLNISRVIDPSFSSTNEKETYNYDLDRDSFNQTSVNASIGYKFNANWRAEANLLRTKSFAEADSGGFLNSNPQSDINRAEISYIRFIGNLSQDITTDIHLSKSANKNWNHSYASIYKTSQDELKVGGSWRTNFGLLLFGYERLEQNIDSSEKYSITSRDVNSVYAGWNGAYKNTSWQLNLRRDDNSQFGGFNTWGLSLGQQIFDNLQVYASKNKSLNAPTFNQLYWPGAGNDKLLPEEALSTEIGFSSSVLGGKFRGSLFDTKIVNMINGWPAVNVDKARNKGWSVEYTASISNWFISANYEHLDAHDSKTGYRLTDRLAEEQAAFSIEKTIGKWNFGTNALYVGHRTDKKGSVKLPSYTTFDANINYKLNKDWSLQARIANLTDRKYETAYGYNQLGRAGYLTLKWAPK